MSGVAQAAFSPPTIISYQGRLADSSGNLLGGGGTTYYFKISFWDSASGGTKVWPAVAPISFTSVVRQGLFNINIGDTVNGYPHALDYDFTSNPNVYLQIEVSSNGSTFETLTPRQAINSSAFAQVASSVYGSGISTMGGLVVNGNTTTTDLSVAGSAYLAGLG